jgi:hypothetical protein
MQLLPPHRTGRPNPDTGVMTPLWTRRQIAETIGSKYALMNLETAGLIPPSEYGYLDGSPLWSLRQAVLVLGVWQWLKLRTEKPGDKFAENQLKARTAMCWKEWKDGNRKRCGNGNHRNARWRFGKLARSCR